MVSNFQVLNISFELSTITNFKQISFYLIEIFDFLLSGLADVDWLGESRISYVCLKEFLMKMRYLMIFGYIANLLCVYS